MVRLIAAIDNQKGIADEHGIPWHGKLPTDVAYYRGKVRGHKYLIGYGTYIHHTKPLPETPTFVASEKSGPLRTGFTKVKNARNFLSNAKEDIWVGGGAGLYKSTIDLADELYLTRINQDFSCTIFFPEFENNFKLISKTPTQTENGISFSFEVWARK